MSIKAGNFALTPSFDCVAVESIEGNTAKCRMAYEHRNDTFNYFDIHELIPFNRKTAKVAREHITDKIRKLNIKIHWMDDCELYLEDE